jgi:hypothetical protein
VRFTSGWVIDRGLARGTRPDSYVQRLVNEQCPLDKALRHHIETVLFTIRPDRWLTCSDDQ